MAWDVEKLQHYVAFYLLEPFGNDWQQTALLCSIIANSIPRKKGSQAYKIEQFLPVKTEEQQTAEDIHAAFAASVAMWNSKQ